MADAIARDIRVSRAGSRAGLGGFMRRKSTIAFLMALAADRDHRCAW